MELINNSFGLGQRLQAFPPALVLGITEPNKSTREIKMKEQIKQIKGYEGLYSISSYGYVISEAKSWLSGLGLIQTKKETIVKDEMDKYGYAKLNLYKNKIRKTFTIHTLVWDSFGNKKRNGHKLQIDHLDNNKLNNRIDNLQLLTPRENSHKACLLKKSSSKYVGVCWNILKQKWISNIRIDKKQTYLGQFDNEYNAHLAYQKALGDII